MFSKNNNGFSLVSVIIAAALLGGLAMAFMKLTRSMSQSQTTATAKSDEIDLRSSIRKILDSNEHCRVSLAGNGERGLPENPVVFKKKDIDEDTEGLDVALYLSNQEGNGRGLKKFNGVNNPGKEDKSKFGKLTISSIKLVMNNGVGSNYMESYRHNDIGQLRVIVEKKISSNKKRSFLMNFDINVGMATGGNGETTILSCSDETKDEESGDEFTYPSKCSVGIQISSGGSSGTNLMMSKGGFAMLPMFNLGDINNGDEMMISGRCDSGGNELDDYLGKCHFDFGWRDATKTFTGTIWEPDSKVSAKFNGPTVKLTLGGDVGDDDSFYFRLRCPSGEDSDLDEYMKNKCMLCMGHADSYRASPERVSCKKVVSEAFPGGWGRLMPSGDVDQDDTLFFGFFCEGEYYLSTY